MNELQKLDLTFNTLTNSLNRFGNNLPKIDFLGSNFYQFAKDVNTETLFQINASLQSYNELISDGPIPTESESEQTHRHLKKFLEKYELTISPKVYSDLTDGYLIEIYSLSHQQIYRSVNYFKLSSYDIGSLTFLPWDKLFYRSSDDVKKMVSVVNDVLDRNIDYMAPNTSAQFITELCTDKIFAHKLIKVGTVQDAFSKDTMGYFSVISVKEMKQAFQVIQ